MATNLFQDNTAQIFGSREAIRSSLTEMVQEYLDLKSVDLNKTCFLSYIINMNSVLTSNLLFYNANIYKEFFFTEAQMPDSVINLGKWIGYYPRDAESSVVDVLFVIPINELQNDSISLQIPQDYKIWADDIPFVLNAGEKAYIELDATMTKTELAKYKNSNISVFMANKESLTVSDCKGKFYPVQLNTVNNSLMFMLPFKQEEIVFDSFSIPYNLEFYQFYSKLLSFPNQQVSSIRVFVKKEIIDGEILPTTYEEFIPRIKEYEEWTISESGLYTMSDIDKKFIWTSTYGTGEVFFGNGIVGVQPRRGSHIVTLMYTTRGLSGTIIPNKITKWETLYYKAGESSNEKVFKFPLILSNPSSSEGGKDIPAMNEIKSEAIANLRSRGRLVSDIDYDDINEIVPYLPVSHTKPVLKRSDLKINEIMVYNALYYQDPAGVNEIVPTRNILFQWPMDSTNLYIDSTATIENPLYIPSGSKSWHDSDNEIFETIFNMVIDPLTLTAKYEYIVEQLAAAASLTENYNINLYSSMSIISTLFTKVEKADPEYPAIYMFVQVAFETDNIENYEMRIITQWNDKAYTSKSDMEYGDIIDIVKVYDNGILTGFGIEFEYINEFPLDMSKFTIEIWGSEKSTTIKPLEKLKIYYCEAIIRKNLQTLMFSYVTEGTNDEGISVYNVYDTPVILTEYLNNIDDYYKRAAFDTYVLQKFINNINLTSTRMLTDFSNIKFCDTWGDLTNMKYNTARKTVITMSLLTVPFPADLENGDLYIVNGGEGYDTFGVNWLNYIHQYALWNVDHWEFSQPIFGDMIVIDNKYDPTDLNQGKKFSFNGKYWMEPIFKIPFLINLKVVRDSKKNISNQGIVESIKSSLIEYFTPKFGLDKNIDRSEIVKVVRGVSGVEYAELLKPEVDLRFDYDVDEMTHEELIDYTPQLVIFLANTITVNFAN